MVLPGYLSLANGLVGPILYVLGTVSTAIGMFDGRILGAAPVTRTGEGVRDCQAVEPSGV